MPSSGTSRRPSGHRRAPSRIPILPLLPTLALIPALILAACPSTPPAGAPALSRVTTDRSWLRDAQGRYAFFHGVNVSGSTKVPAAVDGKAVSLDDLGSVHATGVPSYLGKPFPSYPVAVGEIAAHADAGMKRIQEGGFNVVRLLVTWEGVSPEKPGVYDPDYLASIRTVVEAANRHGLRVLLDMHQDAFSRHLVSRYNAAPSYTDEAGRLVQPPKGTLENTILALLPPYTDTIRGDGAPRWVVEACLPEKQLDSPNWGTPRLLSGLRDPVVLGAAISLVRKLLPSDGGEVVIPGWVQYILDHLPETFGPDETTDVLPLTNWGLGTLLSIDVARTVGCFFVGEKLFPGLRHDGADVKDWLQDEYADAWRQVVRQVRDLPNVLGYDLMNEPFGFYIPLAAVAGLVSAGVPDGARATLTDLLGLDNGENVYNLLTGLRILPPVPDRLPDDATQAEKDAREAERKAVLRQYGLDGMDLFTAIGLNIGYDKAYLLPFYERVGRAVMEEDPDALVFVESSLGLGMILGSSLGYWDSSMTRPDLYRCADAAIAPNDPACPPADRRPATVYEPHYYADIYAFFGFNWPMRSFTVEEVRYRDYEPALRGAMSLVQTALGNAPVVFGEFGTYFNYTDIDTSVAQDYAVSANILDNYYEAFERMFVSRMVWCFAPDNDKAQGDRWNQEDFSIQGFDGEFRAAGAWMRPYPKALAGKPLETHFYSPYHYFDPTSGVVNPEREFLLRYERKETDAPTEISVPRFQYPDGFYVWLSDGYASYDDETQTLLHYPTADAPGTVHEVRILPPLPQRENVGWRYFFRGNRVVSGG